MSEVLPLVASRHVALEFYHQLPLTADPQEVPADQRQGQLLRRNVRAPEGAYSPRHARRIVWSSISSRIVRSGCSCATNEGQLLEQPPLWIPHHRLAPPVSQRRALRRQAKQRKPTSQPLCQQPAKKDGWTGAVLS